MLSFSFSLLFAIQLESERSLNQRKENFPVNQEWGTVVQANWQRDFFSQHIPIFIKAEDPFWKFDINLYFRTHC